MTTTTLPRQAGADAFHRGAPRIPVADPAVEAATRDMRVGDGAAVIYAEWLAGWDAANLEATPAPTEAPERYYFHADSGSAANYAVADYGRPVNLGGLTAAVVITGLRTEVTYTSEANDLTITGKPRRQAGGRWGRRARLSIDTGEGVTTLAGVIVGPLQ